jgi:hypothetical protein
MAQKKRKRSTKRGAGPAKTKTSLDRRTGELEEALETAVEGAVTAEPVGELTLKGIRRPVAVYDVVSARGDRTE